jgi:hypothetical protein
LPTQRLRISDSSAQIGGPVEKDRSAGPRCVDAHRGAHQQGDSRIDVGSGRAAISAASISTTAITVSSTEGSQSMDAADTSSHDAAAAQATARSTVNRWADGVPETRVRTNTTPVAMHAR